MTGLFITGTDTGVGKTLVTATLLAWLRGHGRVALPIKPVQTGWPAADDVAIALHAAGLLLQPALQRRLTPFRYRLAASPHLAARGQLTAAQLARACRSAAPAAAPLLVEGAGGVLVPLNRKETMRDLMIALGLPVLLVARAGLGTLNHTLLALEALRNARLKVMGVILNQLPGQRWGIIERDNLKTLAARAGCPVVRFKPVRLPRPLGARPRLANARRAPLEQGLRANFRSLEEALGCFPAPRGAGSHGADADESK